MKKPMRQPELPLTNETVFKALPEEAIAKCRQLMGQMLREILQAEKKARHEQ
jgi:hypothetical protein